MPNNTDDKTYQQSYSTVNADEERDMGAKGGPSTSLGIPDDKHGVSHPYDADIQTQLAAKSTQNSQTNKNEAPANEEDWKTGESGKRDETTNDDIENNNPIANSMDKNTDKTNTNYNSNSSGNTESNS